MTYAQPKCVIHPDRVAITTAAQIPVCEECHTRYHVEAASYPEQRPFWQELQRAEVNHAATV